ncbi:MAG: hypothetical protein P1P76_10205 [Anaerolineales bacterium]|nr:hypothetical protein [Anaerolineales bacterium]
MYDQARLRREDLLPKIGQQAASNVVKNGDCTSLEIIPEGILFVQQITNRL